ncbi:MAG: hypothetical protein SF182_28950 [Deltaproteobacteria bacterium]|nr:hypothetical protein [Deltaproteobacteria bacterium]
MRQVLAVCLTGSALLAAFFLDGSDTPFRALGLLIACSIALLAISPRMEGGTPLTSTRAAQLAVGLLCVAVVLAVRTTLSVFEPPAPGLGLRQLTAWGGAAACVILAAHLCDRGRATIALGWTRGDWLTAGGVIALAALARGTDLATGPPGLAQDEGGVFAITLETLRSAALPGFGVDHLALTGVFHYISVFFITYFGWLGLDTLQTAKLPGVLFGALAVGALYCAVRLFGSRASAATAALFMIWAGLPWITSRLNYQYAGDMFWIGATTALVLFGFATNRLSCLAAAGVSAAIGAAWLKAALFAAPWAVALLADHALLPPRRGRRVVPLALAFGIALLIGIAPIAAQFAHDPKTFTLARSVAARRDQLLEQAGMSRVEGIARGTVGAFNLLQVTQGHAGRYGVRWNHAALDPIVSALFTIGICASLWRIRERGARIALAGLFIFILPASASYPEEVGGTLTVARRMTSSSMFVAWLAAIGALVVAERVASVRHRAALMLTLASAAMVLNFAAIRTYYYGRLLDWHGEFGINRVHLIHAVREAAVAGPVFVYASPGTAEAYWGSFTLPQVSYVKDQSEIREAIAAGRCQRFCTVILVWPSAGDSNDSPQWISDLQDVIPMHGWSWGPTDPSGTPVYRRAEVRAR